MMSYVCVLIEDMKQIVVVHPSDVVRSINGGCSSIRR